MKWILLTIGAALLLLIGSTVLDALSGPDKRHVTPSDNLAAARLNEDGRSGVVGAFHRLLEDAKKQEGATKLKGEDHNQINFLFLGIGGEEHISGDYLTDTIILIIFIPSTQKTAAISIPRDFLVRAPNKQYFTRINALYAMQTDPPTSGFPGPMGVEYSKDAVKNVIGVPIDYYAVLDLQGIEQIVDILGGINVRRFEDLEDKRFPDENYGYETYEIQEGWRYLNGEEAVKYIRTRHTSGGDFDRMKRQQEVALAIKKKAEGLQTLQSLPKLLSLYKALQDHFTTDLTFAQIMRLMQLGEEAKDDTIVFERITGEAGGLLVSDTIVWGGRNAYILKPRAGTENYEEIRGKVKEIIENLKK